MTMKRRTFIVGSVSGLALLAVTACTDTSTPTPTPTVPVTRSKVPPPAAFERTDWGNDPLARGSSSYQAVGSTLEHREVLSRPVGSRIFLAGEHTADVGAGTLQGARVSGRRVAVDVMERAEPGERIAIIGAGLAGATAARILTDSGYDVVILEGRDRAGGRIHTISAERWPIPIELGAAVVHHADTNSVATALVDADVETTPIGGGVERRTRAGAVVEPSEVAAQAVESAVAWAAVQLADLSIADAMVESGAADVSTARSEIGVSDADLLENFVVADVGMSTGASADELSAWFSDALPVLSEGDELVTGGFERLLERELDGIDILPSSVVTHVTATERGVSLRLVSGESYSAERVVVTVPLGVLKSGSIEFDPPLPFAHRGALAALGMGVLDKLVLRFDAPFWSTDATSWTVVDGDSDFPLWINLLPLTGEPILVGLIGGEAATRLAEYDDRELLNAALASLEPFLDDPPGSPSPSSGAVD